MIYLKLFMIYNSLNIYPLIYLLNTRHEQNTFINHYLSIKLDCIYFQQHDTQFDYFAKKIALADSTGLITIYRLDKQKFIEEAHFKAQIFIVSDQGAIWKISWSHPSYGQLIAAACFNKKVIIFQNQNQKWNFIAQHSLHQGSVNYVQFCPFIYGLKVYGGGSDGYVSILQYTNSNWKSWKFQAHELAINSISTQPNNLIEETVMINYKKQMQYCRFATCSRDKTIKIWFFDIKLQKYISMIRIQAHSQWIKDVKWRPSFLNNKFQIFSCSQNKTVKCFQLEQKQQKLEVVKSTIICQFDGVPWRLCFSEPGLKLGLSIWQNGKGKTVILKQRIRQKQQWSFVQQV